MRFGTRVLIFVLSVALAAVTMLSLVPAAQAAVGSCNNSGHFHTVGHPLYGGEVYDWTFDGSTGFQEWTRGDVSGSTVINWRYLGSQNCGGYPPYG